MVERHREQINNIATQLAKGAKPEGPTPGNQTWIGHHREACSKFKAAMTEEQKEEIEELVKVWNKVGPSVEAQERYNFILLSCVCDSC